MINLNKHTVIYAKSTGANWYVKKTYKEVMTYKSVGQKQSCLLRVTTEDKELSSCPNNDQQYIVRKLL